MSSLSYQSARDARSERDEQLLAAREKGALWIVLIAITAAVVVVMVLAWPRSRTPSRASMIRQDSAMLMAGLERFRGERGIYPASLSELTPQYIDRMPRATGWNYQPSADRFSFRLTFTLGVSRVTWDSATRQTLTTRISSP